MNDLNVCKSSISTAVQTYITLCQIDVFTLNIIPLRHQKSRNYQQQQKYRMILKKFLLYDRS